MVAGGRGGYVLWYIVLMSREVCTRGWTSYSSSPTFGRAACGNTAASRRSKATIGRCAAAPAISAEACCAPSEADVAWEAEAGARPA